MIAAYVLISGDGDLDTAHHLLPGRPGPPGRRPGDYYTTRALTDQMIQWAAPCRARTIQMHAWQVRGVAVLGSGDFEEAYQQVPPQKTASGGASGAP